MRLTADLNQRLSQEQQTNMELSEKLREAQAMSADLKKSIASIQKTSEVERVKALEREGQLDQKATVLEAELQDVRSHCASLTSRNTYLDETLRAKQADFYTSLNTKDDKIIEV